MATTISGHRTLSVFKRYNIVAQFRDECLNENWFLDLDDARLKIETWRHDYNTVRPHSALGNRTPAEYAKGAGLAA